MHIGLAPQPHDVWRSWSVEPGVLASLALGAGLYARGVQTLWRRAGRGHGIPPWRVACASGALLALVVALVSPLDAMAESLFAAHMVQHLLLIVVAAPLLVLGDPLLATLWALPPNVRRAFGRAWRRLPRLGAPIAWSVHVATLWAWHARGPYDAAVRHPIVHALEHVSFVVTAVLFWLAVADRRAHRRLGPGAAVLYLFAAALQSTALGALLTVATRPWYQAHLATTGPWGLTPLEDQQLAGLIMWIPAGLVYVGAGLGAVAGALRERKPRELMLKAAVR